MPLTLADRVRDTTTTTGTGSVTLSGTAPTGYQNFSVIGNGNTTYYTINAGSQWEVGIGTYSSTGPTLARTTVLESSNGNALVDFAAGTKDVFVTYPADKSVNYDESNNVGIGTTTPSSKLSVISSTTSLAQFTGPEYAQIRHSDGVRTMFTQVFDNQARLFSETATPLVLGTSNTERVRITAAGLVQINTTSGGGWLNVNSSSGAPPLLLTNSANSNPFIQFANGSIIQGIGESSLENLRFRAGGTTGTLLFDTNATERMRITAAGDVGIGSNAPVNYSGYSTLTIQNTNGGVINLRNGTVTAQAEIAVTPSELYVAAVSATPLAFKTTNTERMRITAAGDVGIGTASPGTRLAINDPGTGLGFTNAASGNFNLGLLAGTGSADAYVFQRANAPLIVGTSNTERMRITATGDVGIGTSSPGARLEVSGTATLTADVSGLLTLGRFSAGYPWALVRPDASATGIEFRSNAGTPQMSIVQATGNVGIGTSSVSAVFGTTVKVYSAGSGGTLEVGGATVNARFYGSEGLGSGGIGTSTNHPFTFISNNTERMRITAAGDVGIGTSAPSTRMSLGPTIGRKLSVFDGGGVNSGLGVDMSGSGFELSFFSGYNGGNGQFTFGGFNTATNTYTERMRITAAGDVGIGTASPQARLDVNSGASAAAAVFNSTSNTYLQLQNSGTNGLYLQSAASAAYLINQLNTPFLFGTNNTERMRLSGSGNLGVGTTATNVKFTVGGAAGNPTLNAASGIAEFRLDVTTMLAIGGYSSGSFALWLQGKQDNAGYTTTPWPISLNPAGGNVGVGTASPPSQLSVSFNPPVSIPALGSGVGGVSIGPATAYGMLVGTISDGNGYIQQQRFDGGTTVYNLLLQPSGGNVGIGTSAPGAKLVVSNAGAAGYEINPTGGVGGGATVSTYNRSTAAYTTLTTYSSAMTWYVGAAGTTRAMDLDSSGNLLVGTTTAFARLAVNGSAYVAAGNDLQVGNVNNTNAASINSDSTDTSAALVFKTASAGLARTERMRITSGGLVQINTTSGSGHLNVNGTTGAPVIFLSDSSGSPFLQFANGSFIQGISGGILRLRTTTASAIVLDTNSAERVRITETGNVGIGTSAPNANLQISSASTTVLRLTTTGAATQSSLAFATVGGTGTVDMDQGGNMVFRTQQASMFFDNFSAGGAINFRTGGANTRMAITNDGNVGIGTASPSTTLDVASAALTPFILRSSQAAVYQQFVNSGNASGFIGYTGSSLTFWTGPERMRIDGNGNVGIGTSSPSERLNVSGNILATGNVTAYSDIRLKDNVEQIGGALERVSAIRGVTYTRNDLEDKQRRYAGVIAQELEQVLPEAVSHSGDMKAVDYNATIGLLIEAIKELTARVAQLEGTKP